MNVYLPNKRLPSTFQEVEYIQSSGTQYINTGYVPTTSFNFELKYNISSKSSNVYYALFGSRNSEYSTGAFYIGYYNNVGFYQIAPNFVYNESTVVMSTLNTDITLSYKNGVLSDGTNTKSISFTKAPTFNLYIFGGNAGGTISDNSSYRLYSFKMYNGTTLVRDFVPVYRKSDGVIGLYDLVNNQFYTNSGTGTFSKGNDVTMVELKNAYIGEVWTPGSNTIAYYPLTSNTMVNDMSGNNRNLTKYGSCTFGTYQGVSCLYLPGSESSYLKYNGDSGSYYNFTMSFYYYCMDVGNWSNILYSNDNGVFVNPSNQPRFSGANNIPNTPTITNSWKHIVCVANGSVAKIYINGVAYSGDWQTSRSISTAVEVSGTGSGHSSKGYVSNIIIESKARTDTEVLNYYNNTKANYGH